VLLKEPARELVPIEVNVLRGADANAAGGRPLMPAWAWVFVVACAPIGAFGVIPIVLAFAAVVSIFAISREWEWSALTRAVLSAAVTLGGWLGLVLLWSFIHTVPH
jgi:hypothetical protein